MSNDLLIPLLTVIVSVLTAFGTFWLTKRQDEAIEAKDRQLAEQATISKTQRKRIDELIAMDQMRRRGLTQLRLAYQVLLERYEQLRAYILKTKPNAQLATTEALHDLLNFNPAPPNSTIGK